MPLMRALSSAPAAVCMRLHRKRRREGTHYLLIPSRRTLRTDDDRRSEKEIAAPLQSEDQTFRYRMFEDFVVQWLNQHPALISGLEGTVP